MEILIVEDDKSIREVLETYLCDESRGQNCDHADTLAGAIGMVGRKKYDLILLDLLLADGLSVPIIKLSRELYPDAPPTICMISAMHGAKQIAEENNVNSFIPKPFDLDTIDDLVIKRKCI